VIEAMAMAGVLDPDLSKAQRNERLAHAAAQIQLSDAEAITVLTNVRRVMSPTGRVLLIDPVLPEGDVPHQGKFMDITMLALSRGRDRTARDLAEVLEKAGLRLAETVGLAAPSSVAVGVPA
jgi:hypothetical protein